MVNRASADGYAVKPLKRVRNAVQKIMEEVGPFSFDVKFMGREGKEIKKFFGRAEVRCEELYKQGVAHHLLNYLWRTYNSTREEDIYLFLKQVYERRDMLGVSIVLNDDGTITINWSKVGSAQKAARQKTHVILWEERDFAENTLVISMLEDIIHNLNTSSLPFYLEKLKETRERLKRKRDPNKVEARRFIDGGLGLIGKRGNWPAALFKLWAAIDRLEKRKSIIEEKILPKAERERRAILYYLSKSIEADYLVLKGLEFKDPKTLRMAREALLGIWMGSDYEKNIASMLLRILKLKEYGDEQMASIINEEARSIVSHHLELLLKK